MTSPRNLIYVVRTIQHCFMYVNTGSAAKCREGYVKAPQTQKLSLTDEDWTYKTWDIQCTGDLIDIMKRLWTERAGICLCVCVCCGCVLTSSLRLLTRSTPPGPECPDNATLPAAAAAAAAALRGLMAPKERGGEEGPCQLTQPRRAYSSASQADLPCGYAFYLSAPTTPSTSSYAANTTHLGQTHIPESISATRQIAIWTDFTQTGALEQYPNQIAFWALSARCS